MRMVVDESARLKVIAGEIPVIPIAVDRPTLRLSVFGGFAVATYGGREIHVRSRKTRALLAYIALSDSRTETRERLVGLLWSESGEEKARASLRQSLRELRQCFAELGYAGLRADKLTIGIDDRLLTVDLFDVVRAAEDLSAHALILNTPRLAERLLDGFDDIDPEFRVWLLAKRQTIHDRLLRNLERGLASADLDGLRRRQIAEAILNLDPTHEQACRGVMQSRAEEGDTAGALRAYKTLWHTLDDEYGMEPSVKTQELVARIKTGELEPPAGDETELRPIASAPTMDRLSEPDRFPHERASATPAPKVMLLFSAFGMNGIHPDKAHLVQGFRHHLIASLIRFREWYVIDGVTSTSGATRSQTVVPEYHVDATAYQAGDAINLVLTLKEASINLFVWSESFELRLENWFDTQQRIVRRIAVSLNVQVSMERLKRLANEPDISLEVYDRWLRGRAIIRRFSPSNWTRAEEIFSETIREAPNFSLGYSSLVQMNNSAHIAHPGRFRDQKLAQTTLELARTAVQLDPIDSQAQLCLGWSHAMIKQYGQASIHMNLACELNENDPWTLISSALFFAFTADARRATELSRQSMEMTRALSPAHWAYQVSVRFLCEDYDGTIDAADLVGDAFRTVSAWKSAALFLSGRHAHAQSEARRFLNGIRSFWLGTDPPDDETIGRWLMHLYPIGDRRLWERLREGVSGAGIPVVGIDHHSW